MPYLSLSINSVIFITLIAAFPILYFKFAFNAAIPQKDFRIWAFSWYVVTLFAFFTFNFYVFMLISAVFIFFIAKKTENKLALYCVLLFAIPSFQEKISVLFSLNFTRELGLVLLLPLLYQAKKQQFLPKFGKVTTDKLVLIFLILMFALQFRGLYSPIEPSTWTEESRWALYFFAEIFLPYYIASRYIKDFKQLTSVILSLVFIFSIVGSIGIVESAKSWLLYGDLHQMLALSNTFGTKEYLSRDGMLRASSTLDHALVLGYVMLIAIGFYLFVSNYIKSSWLKVAGLLLLIGGLISPFARGAWVGTVVMLIVYFSIGNKRFRNISLMTIAGLLALPLLTIIPGGEKVINLLPFIGNVESANVDYRTKLFEQSILVIKNYPFFGLYNPTLEPEMQVLVQGQGIVDLVNYYLQIALTYGLVGLAILAMIIFSILLPLNKHLKSFKNQSSLEYLCGKSFLAMLIGILITIATISALNMITTVLFLILGLTISYIRVTKNSDENVANYSEESINTGEYPTSRIIKKAV